MDDRIVIVDIGEKSLAEMGHWPWGRNRLADLVHELLERQNAALLGFDVVSALEKTRAFFLKAYRVQIGTGAPCCCSISSG